MNTCCKVFGEAGPKFTYQLVTKEGKKYVLVSPYRDLLNEWRLQREELDRWSDEGGR